METLALDQNTISDEGTSALGNALTQNTALKHLSLGFNGRITASGWVLFSTSLENSDNSTLEVLVLRHSRIDYRGLVALANALATNTGLKELNLRCTRHADNIGWPPIIIALCTTPSVHSRSQTLMIPV